MGEPLRIMNVHLNWIPRTSMPTKVEAMLTTISSSMSEPSLTIAVRLS